MKSQLLKIERNGYVIKREKPGSRFELIDFDFSIPKISDSLKVAVRDRTKKQLDALHREYEFGAAIRFGDRALAKKIWNDTSLAQRHGNLLNVISSITNNDREAYDSLRAIFAPKNKAGQFVIDLFGDPIMEQYVSARDLFGDMLAVSKAGELYFFRSEKDESGPPGFFTSSGKELKINEGEVITSPGDTISSLQDSTDGPDESASTDGNSSSGKKEKLSDPSKKAKVAPKPGTSDVDTIRESRESTEKAKAKPLPTAKVVSKKTGAAASGKSGTSTAGGSKSSTKVAKEPSSDKIPTARKENAPSTPVAKREAPAMQKTPESLSPDSPEAKFLKKYGAFLGAICKAFNLPPNLVLSVIERESHFNDQIDKIDKNKLSSGLMQLTVEAVRDMKFKDPGRGRLFIDFFSKIPDSLIADIPSESIRKTFRTIKEMNADGMDVQEKRRFDQEIIKDLYKNRNDPYVNLLVGSIFFAGLEGIAERMDDATAFGVVQSDLPRIRDFQMSRLQDIVTNGSGAISSKQLESLHGKILRELANPKNTEFHAKYIALIRYNGDSRLERNKLGKSEIPHRIYYAVAVLITESQRNLRK